MKKQNGLLIGGAIVIALVGGYIAYNAFARGRSKEEEDAGNNIISQINRPETLPNTEITAEDATALMAEATGENPLYDLYRCYYDNNMIFLDTEAPCNKGDEALRVFVERFSNDSQFQVERTQIMEGGMNPDFSTISLSIYDPDSTNFFGAWKYISANEASFCHGWLGSEMLEEYTFTRTDSSSRWLLTDYFSAEEVYELE